MISATLTVAVWAQSPGLTTAPTTQILSLCSTGYNLKVTGQLCTYNVHSAESQPPEGRRGMFFSYPSMYLDSAQELVPGEGIR